MTKIKVSLAALITSLFYLLVINYDIGPFREIIFPTDVAKNGGLIGAPGYIIPIAIGIIIGLLTKNSLKEKFINTFLYIALFFVLFFVLFFLLALSQGFGIH